MRDVKIGRIPRNHRILKFGGFFYITKLQNALHRRHFIQTL